MSTWLRYLPIAVWYQSAVDSQHELGKAWGGAVDAKSRIYRSHSQRIRRKPKRMSRTYFS